jgi:putative thioredoxin
MGLSLDILGGVIFDATDETFERDVVERSRELPVVVDFWAAWCGPCRQLTPVLEKAVNARDGRVALAKVDTDANPRVSAAFRIQSIPSVKAFKDGRLIDEFMGAQPGPVVERFLDSLLPSEADGLVASGSEEDLRRALELEPGRADAAVPLARLLAAKGERDEALAILDDVAGSFAAEGLAARLRLEQDEPELAPAFADLDSGETERGLDGLIGAIPAAEQARKDDLRRIVVGVLDELGPGSDLARESRRRLASALY